MEKQLIVSIFVLAAALCRTPAAGARRKNGGEESWAKRVHVPAAGGGKEVVTKLQFYFHDKLSGSNPSAIRVVQGPGNYSRRGAFGTITMGDDPLTVGPDPKSKEVGRARGLYGSAGKDEVCLIVAMSYGFTVGDYAGSSFSLLSSNHVLDPVREMAVVGGTGLFRLARGYALAHTYSLDLATGDAIIGYNVTLLTHTHTHI
ncbi:hypothetical protein DM860_003276 [Cuscuta australis]|uniref:Dirigent protein n=1 Tax=Cuscuta australis TaxID=267555 RepID=A0A328D742_9ASTE|nr:hypothetical protein DM860_003276 [Cuscuta australis]